MCVGRRTDTGAKNLVSPDDRYVLNKIWVKIMLLNRLKEARLNNSYGVPRSTGQKKGRITDA